MYIYQYDTFQTKQCNSAARVLKELWSFPTNASHIFLSRLFRAFALTDIHPPIDDDPGETSDPTLNLNHRALTRGPHLPLLALHR